MVGFYFTCCGLAAAQGPITFQYLYDDLGQLVKVIDSTGTVIEYVYDPAGNILEIKRSTARGLAVFGFTPRQGAPGTTVGIRGQGFSAVESGNTVAFNGATAQVVSADGNNLVVSVPTGATTGRIVVAVGGVTAMSDRDFVVVAGPVVESVDPAVVVSEAEGAVVVPLFRVTGHDLDGSTFHFEPVFDPALVRVTGAFVESSGDSAILGLTIAPRAAGSFVLVASSALGSSSTLGSEGNTLLVLFGPGDEDQDGLKNRDELEERTDPFDGDSDGDGFGDGDEVGSQSDALDPESVPVDPQLPIAREAASVPITVLNQGSPCAAVDGIVPPQCLSRGEAAGAPFSVLNTADPCTAVGGVVPASCLIRGESAGTQFSVLNTADPCAPVDGVTPSSCLIRGESAGAQFSVLNTTDPCAPADGVVPPSCLMRGETMGTAFSLLNTADPCAPVAGVLPAACLIRGETAGTPFSVLNGADPCAPVGGIVPVSCLIRGEAVSLPLSVLNTP